MEKKNLRLLIEHAPIALAMFDTEMRYLAVSRRWVTDYHLAGQNIIGRSHYDVFPEIPDRWKAVHRRGLSGEAIEAQEDSFNRLDGSVQWQSWAVQPWYAADSTVGGIIIVTEDTTERKETRNKLQHYELLAENSRDMILFARESDGRIVEANAAAIRAYGYTKKELLEMTVYDLRPPEYRVGQAAQLTKAAKNWIQFETVQVRKGGTSFPAEITSQGVVIDNSQMLIGIIRDITNRKQAEEALRQSASLLARSQEIAHVGSWMLDVAANQLTWSDEAYRIFGLKPQEFGATYEAFLDIVHPDDRAAVDAAYTGSLREGKDTYEIEHRIVHKDTGEVRYVSEKCIHERDGSGQILRSIGMTQDITDSKQAEFERETTVEFLEMVNTCRTTEELIRTTVGFFQHQSGCEAVGIRLACGEDYPYYEARGFPAAFIKAESPLCSRDPNGAILRDDVGNPVLECMCGNVIQGRFDASKPFFSEKGSFWTNSTSELLASTTEADRQARTRNRCHGEGYESVGLVPLFWGKERLGLLQLNDRRKGLFTADLIALWERIAGYLSVALAKLRMEEKLREAEANYRQIVETANEGIWAMDGQYRTTFANRHMAEILGYLPEEMIGQRVDAFMFAEDLQDHATKMRARERGQGGVYERRFRCKDGREIWTLVSATALKGADGEFTGSFAMFTDITQRRLAEEALQASEKQHAAILKTSMDGFMLLDTRGRLLQVNDTYCRMSGYSEPELLSMGISDLDATESPDETRAHIQKIMGHGEDRFESQHWRKDGTVFHVEVSVQYKPDKGGYQVVFLRDITERKAAEKALAEESTRRRILFEQSPDGIVIIDPDTARILEFNDAAHKQLGYSSEEFAGLSVTDIEVQETAQETKARISSVIQDGRADFETLQRTRQGEVRNIHVTAQYINAQGIPVYQCIWRDITERKQAEIALKKREAIFASIVEQATEAIAVLDNATGRFVEFNRAAHDGLGYSREEFGGLTISDIQAEHSPEVIRRNFQIIREEGQVAFGTKHLHRNGEIRDVHVSVRMLQVKDYDCCVAVWTDITEKKRAEAIIRESADRSRRLIEASTDGIILRSEEIIIDANPAAVKLFRANSANDLIGKPYLDLVHPDDRAGTLERIKKVLSGNWVAPPREHRILSLNGEVVDVESTGVTVLQGDEKLIFGIFRDITERKRVEREREKLEDQLRQAQKMESLGTLAGGIAHDFNNILGVIIGNSDMLAMTGAVEEDSRATLDNILSASQRAKELVRQILAFSRHAKQEKILLNLKPLVRETFDFLRASIPANIQLKHQLDPDVGTIMADPTQMQQVLMNLSTNAVHAMEGDGGVLRVELSKASLGPEDLQFEPDLEPGKHVRVTVSDTGHGIARDIIDKVFDPYFTTKEKGKGTGLGLSVVHGIVKAHGGSIKVYSEVGKGTTFQFPLCARRGNFRSQGCTRPAWWE